MASDSQHALVLDYRRLVGTELLSDPELVAMRACDIRCTLGPLLRLLLPGLGAGQIHGAGLVSTDGRGLLALGPSGAGKSTLARLASCRYHVLGDDRVVLWGERDGFSMDTDPANEMSDGSLQARLCAVLWLRHGRAFALRPRRWPELLPEIWRDNRGQWTILPVALRTRLYGLFCSMLSAVPVLEMTFRKDAVDWDAVEDTARALSMRQPGA